MEGPVVLPVAAHCRDRERAGLSPPRRGQTVSYYGVGLDNLLGERQNISKPLLLHIATRDKFSPPEAQAKVRAALKDNPLVTIYEYDADHAFARGSGSARVPALAQQADERTQSFFSDKLA